MPDWTEDDHFRFAVRMALSRVTVRGFRRALSEAERDSIAATIVDQLRRSGWRWRLRPHEIGPGLHSRSVRSGEEPDG